MISARNDDPGDISGLIRPRRSVRIDLQIDLLRISGRVQSLLIHVVDQRFVGFPQIIITAPVIDGDRKAGGIAHRLRRRVIFVYGQAGPDRKILDRKFTLQQPFIGVLTEFGPGAADRNAVSDELLIKCADRKDRMISVFGLDGPAQAKALGQLHLMYGQVACFCTVDLKIFDGPGKPVPPFLKLGNLFYRMYAAVHVISDLSQ